MCVKNKCIAHKVCIPSGMRSLLCLQLIRTTILLQLSSLALAKNVFCKSCVLVHAKITKLQACLQGIENHEKASRAFKNREPVLKPTRFRLLPRCSSSTLSKVVFWGPHDQIQTLD